MANIFSLYGSIFIDNEKANKAIDGTTKKGENFASKLGGVFSKVGKGALALGGTLTTAATAIGGLAINTSKDVDQSVRRYIQKQLWRELRRHSQLNGFSFSRIIRV